MANDKDLNRTYRVFFEDGRHADLPGTTRCGATVDSVNLWLDWKAPTVVEVGRSERNGRPLIHVQPAGSPFPVAVETKVLADHNSVRTFDLYVLTAELDADRPVWAKVRMERHEEEAERLRGELASVMAERDRWKLATHKLATDLDAVPTGHGVAALIKALDESASNAEDGIIARGSLDMGTGYERGYVNGIGHAVDLIRQHLTAPTARDRVLSAVLATTPPRPIECAATAVMILRDLCDEWIVSPDTSDEGRRSLLRSAACASIAGLACSAEKGGA